MIENGHKPVLLDEVLNGLNVRPGGCYVDCTFGRGGHSQAILQRLDESGRLFVFDKDTLAIKYANSLYSADPRVTVTHGSFIQLQDVIEQHECLGKVDGILLDLGVSSPQLDNPERGFSFQKEGQLDMRMNTTKGVTAKDWVNTTAVEEMATVFKKYGEEKFARRIARAIEKQRQQSVIETTMQLAELIRCSVPRQEREKHPATRVFQAIRIVVNQELEELEKVLPQTMSVLAVKGRLVTISFHSLEDRIVKRFIREQEKADPYPSSLPIEADRIQPKLLRVGRAVKANADEVQANVRARSAVLRIAERTAA